MMSQTIAQYWQQADSFAQALALLLLLMSLISWTIILAKAWQLSAVLRSARSVAAFWTAPDLQAGCQLLQVAGRHSPYLFLASALPPLLEHPAQHLGRPAALSDRLSATLRQALQAQTRVLESGLTVLASIASSAPFVGLLGTVWGIHQALLKIADSGAVQIDQLAGPVGETLIMTAFGLVVAIPALLAYNALGRQIRLHLAQLDGFAHDLHAHFSATQPAGPA
ncbi:MotA/TolQ/ExbB proton channel family protein [Undibacterium crateris]|uniref:MotA/TolQ/ExbB proton channel family protein n=1 Tax=Undibacterium crateris TaxID=2528175 RepID=UPI001F18DF63|nr:MotA/TolQ/ExbB proton channel family protein [Undibacterium crateris]